MGMGIVERLVAKGWKVAIADVKANAAFAEQLGAASKFFACDVADYDSQAGMFQKVWDTYGRIDALCANAGIVDRRQVTSLSMYREAEDG
jgi:NAD(P)-dependent dehydrogenase (short-subunit alcohol dehydrogenase family)